MVGTYNNSMWIPSSKHTHAKRICILRDEYTSMWEVCYKSCSIIQKHTTVFKPVSDTYTQRGRNCTHLWVHSWRHPPSWVWGRPAGRLRRPASGRSTTADTVQSFYTEFFCKLLLNGASHDTKIGCIKWAWTNKYKCSSLPFLSIITLIGVLTSILFLSITLWYD